MLKKIKSLCQTHTIIIFSVADSIATELGSVTSVIAAMSKVYFIKKRKDTTKLLCKQQYLALYKFSNAAQFPKEESVFSVG